MKYVEIERKDNGAAALAVSRGFSYAYTTGQTFDLYRKATVEGEITRIMLDEVEALPIVPHLACAKIGSNHYATFDQRRGTLLVVNVDGGSRVLPTELDREGANDLLQFLFDIKDIIS